LPYDLRLFHGLLQFDADHLLRLAFLCEHLIGFVPLAEVLNVVDHISLMLEVKSLDCHWALLLLNDEHMLGVPLSS